MSEINKLISKKLKKYSMDTQKIITEAFRLAERHENANNVKEELKGFLFAITKKN